MLTLGFLALLVALVLLVILFLLGRMWTLEVAFVRLAWIPLAALALQVILSRPMTRSLGYASILPPLLTCIVSLFFGLIGTTLLAARSRTERHPRLLWSTLVAGMPGALLIVYLVVSLASFLVRG